MLTLFKPNRTDSMIDTFFDDFFEPSFNRSWTNKFDKDKIIKKENEYKLLLPVPGLSDEDIRISTKDNVLNIVFDKSERDESHYFTSHFSRKYKIPDDVNESEISGSIRNGVVEISLPFNKEKSRERLIELR